jgi:hypothetical protein
LIMARQIAGYLEFVEGAKRWFNLTSAILAVN